MSVNVVINSIKFYDEFKNDIGFVSNLGDYTENLADSIMEKVQVVQEIDINWTALSSVSNLFLVTNSGTRITRQYGNWSDDGVTSGDNVRITYYDSGGTFHGPFIGVADSVIGNVINFLVAPVSVTPPTVGPLPESNFQEMIIRAWQPLENLIYKFGLIGLSENTNFNSKVSGNEQGYYGSGIGFDTGGGVRSTTPVVLQKLNQYKDWITGTATCAYVSNPDTFTQRFEIVHTFIVNPYYVEGELSNLQDLVVPDLYLGGNTLKYVYEADFRSTISNAGTSKKSTIDFLEGSVAWFNENFNGFTNNYNVKSITYEDAGTSDSADGLLIGTKTKVTVLVENLLGSYTGAERFGVYVSYLPSQAEYENTTLTTLVDNFIYDRAINNEGLPFTTGDDFITKCEANVVSGDLEIVFEMEYDSLQKAFLSGKLAANDANYLIGIQVGDNTLTSGDSDKVMILADAKAYDESPDISGLMDFDKFDIYPHPEQIGSGTPSTDMVAWNEDGLVVDYDFYLNLNQDAVIQDLKFLLVAYNPTTGQYFLLDQFNFVVATAVVSAGVQQLNDTQTRNYILKAGDQFNDMTIQVGSQAAGLQHYTGRFAQKISWQDWIQNLGVDTVFYDVTKPNNNLNNKSSNYSLLNDYEIRLAVSANLDGVSLLGVSGNTNYLFVSPTVTVYDYEDDGNVTPVWGCVIKTFNNANMSDLSGSILTGQDTLFRATWTNSGGPVTTLTDIWGINRIEKTGQTGYEITEMSSLNDPAVGQILEPSTGTLLNVYLDSGNVVMECLIDGSQVVSGQEYNLSSRIQDDNAVPAGAKITESGVVKVTETDVIKIIE